MRTITLKINGKNVTAQVEPRMHLADFLREQLLLTGTHIGCEHGICGACTVELQGEIVRSCITYAVQCDGADITTIEGFDDDSLMTRLRAAFSKEHALQCGYCTPGMLITARELVNRVGNADEQQIRTAMSGNLCRCTGYMGIVAAIRRVMAENEDASVASPSCPNVGPAPGPSIETTEQLSRDPAAGNRSASPSRSAEEKRPPTTIADISDDNLTKLNQSFTVEHQPAEVWDFFGDLRLVARCLPGAVITNTENDTFEGEIRVKMGPISTAFACEGRVARNDDTRHATVLTQGRDAKSASRMKGRIDYNVQESADGATRVEVEVGYALAGSLAQFGRGGIVVDLANQLTREFARNMEARLADKDSPGDEAAEPPAALDAGGLFFSALWTWIKNFTNRLLHRN